MTFSPSATSTLKGGIESLLKQKINPDIVVDISSQMNLKLDAVKAYSTQFFNPESKESETIISSQGFLDSVTYRAKNLGRQSNCGYAEGFVVHQLPKIDSLLNL